MKRSYISILLVSALLLAACGGSSGSGSSEGFGHRESVPGGAYVNASVDELLGMLSKKDFVFVNTHVPFEGDIAKTDLSIPYDEIGRRASELPAPKDAKIVLYCRSGSMSTIAAETLVGMGYTNVWELDGGMIAWEKAGLPLEGR